jgi:DNA-binding NarL/FixJ family response regulator
LVVLLSTYQSEDLPDDASACGAAAYVHKEDFGPEVLEDVWRRSRGGAEPFWRR